MADAAPRPTPRPFRFLADPGEFADGPALRDIARRAESMGYASLVYPDHIVAPLGFLPVLASVAAVTDRLRVQPFVANNDLRHPVLLAQDLATIDVLSGGRVDVGLGAGWNRPEYEALGLEFEPVGVRVARLAEAVAVIKGCFADGAFSVWGEHYTVTEHEGLPKPVQKPHPPIFIGGGGRRVLTLAAREAAGERFADLEFNVYPTGVPATITKDARKIAADTLDRIRNSSGVELSIDEWLASPNVFVGTLDTLVAKVRELRERLGISSYMLGDVDGMAPLVERLAGS